MADIRTNWKPSWQIISHKKNRLLLDATSGYAFRVAGCALRVPRCELRVAVTDSEELAGYLQLLFPHSSFRILNVQ